MNPEDFKSSFLAALEDQEVVERYKLIFEPLLKSLVLPLTNKVSDTVTALTQTINSLKNELAEKDSIIRELRSDVSHLQIAVEWQSRTERSRTHGYQIVTFLSKIITPIIAANMI